MKKELPPEAKVESCMEERLHLLSISIIGDADDRDLVVIQSFFSNNGTQMQHLGFLDKLIEGSDTTPITG